jgi:Domain of unknown function (DUF4388)
MGTNQTLDPSTALALYLPRSQSIFRSLESNILHLSRVEEIIARRDQFHGVLEFIADQGGVQVIYVDGVRSAILLTPGISSKVQQFEDLAQLEARVSLYPLDPLLARIASSFSTAQASNLNQQLQQLGIQQVFRLLLEAGSSGVLHLVSSAVNAQVFMNDGQILHTRLNAANINSDQVVPLEHLLKVFASGEVRGVLYQTKLPLRPLDLQSSGSSPANPVTAAVAVPASPEVILKGWSELLRQTSSLAQQHGISSFDRAWRTTGVALCEQHPMLDPFSAELTWSNGVLELYSDSDQGLLEALTAGFLQTISSLGLPLEQVLIRVKLMDLVQAHPASNLERLLPGTRRQP